MRGRSPSNHLELATLTTDRTDDAKPALVATVKDERRNLPPAPVRWRTKEFYFYYVAFCLVVPYICWTGVQISSDTLPNYAQYSHRLSEGWLFGRMLDNSDGQYREFRAGMPLLFVAAAVYVTISQLLNRTYSAAGGDHADRRAAVRRAFYLVSSLVFMLAISGANLLKILAIVGCNYIIAKVTRGSLLNPLVTWCFNLTVLVFNEKFEGYMFGNMFDALSFLDAYSGIMPRWEIHFKFAMLRMVSFNMDYYWCCRGAYQQVGAKERQDPEKARIQTPRRPDEYSWLNYLAYLFYIPLFLAGPIISFNNFVAQMHNRPSCITLKKTLLYAARVFGSIFLMELMMHYLYVIAISKTKAWSGFTPYEISIIGYFNLKFIWLKLLVIWRFFRLWAMADGVDVPENMDRCMSNNYSAQGFWRSWHRSYNRWLIRYVYIPLGGTKYALYNIWPVFTFVAVWHDVSFKLLAWAWLICLFLVPEIVLGQLFKPYRGWKHYRHIAAIGGAGNMIMMAVANLVGFAVGVDGMKEMGKLILTPSGVTFLIIGPCCLFIAVQLMFELRESEKRQGIRK